MTFKASNGGQQEDKDTYNPTTKVDPAQLLHETVTGEGGRNGRGRTDAEFQAGNCTPRQKLTLSEMSHAQSWLLVMGDTIPKYQYFWFQCQFCWYE